jgi:hypothetical protein
MNNGNQQDGNRAEFCGVKTASNDWLCSDTLRYVPWNYEWC